MSTGTYRPAQPVNPSGLQVLDSTPLVSVSDGGTVRLEQGGRSILLTLAEVRFLAEMVG